ncbi:MAG: hypothetical protein WAM73_04355, partial [Desulfobacterales bacterium]
HQPIAKEAASLYNQAILAGRPDKLNVNLKKVGNTPGHGIFIDPYGLQGLFAFIGFPGLSKHLFGEIAVSY